MTKSGPASPLVVPRPGKGAAGRAWAARNTQRNSETRAALVAIRQAPMLQLAPATRTLLLGVVELAEAALLRGDGMVQHTQAAGDASLNLQRAANRLEAAATSPEEWGGVPVVAEASMLVGAVAYLASLAQVQATAQRKGGKQRPAGTKAARISALATRDLSATPEDIATALAYDDKATSHEYVARIVRAVRKKPTR